MDALFWFFILFLVIAIYFYKRIGQNEARILELENRLNERRVAEVSQTTPAPAPVSASVIPSPAPLPAPAPSPVFVSEVKETMPKESQEETSARWLGRIGAFAVFVGVAFFLKYLFDNDIIGERGRVALGVFAGLAAIGVGQKLRAKYLNYSDLLMGVGIGILYLSLYASYGFYHLLSAQIVFVLMALVTFLGLVLSVTGGSMGLAVLATLGGFLTPVFLSTGENHLVTLSIYMIILDLGVFGIGLFKKWTKLNYLSFIGTLMLFGGWMSTYYTSAQLGMTYFFVGVFFLIFLATSVVHHLLRKESTTAGDMLLLVMNAAGFFGVSCWLLWDNYHVFLGFLALLLAVLYLGVAYLAYTSNRADRTLNLFLPGISVVFLTVAVPLQLSGYAIAFAWLVEAVILIATGLYLSERVIRIFGWLVLALGFIKVLEDVDRIRNIYTSDGGYPYGNFIPTPAVAPFLNWGFFLMLMSVVACYAIAYLYRYFRMTEEDSKRPYLLALFLGGFVTAIALTLELRIKMVDWETLPWLLEGILMLIIGLRLRSRILEVAGWVFAGIGMMMMTQDVSHMHQEIISYGARAAVATTPTVPAFLNFGFFLYILSIATTYLFASLYRMYGGHLPDWKKLASVFIILANIFTIMLVTSEISYKYDKETRDLYHKATIAQTEYNNYLGNPNPYGYTDYSEVAGASVDNKKIAEISSAKDTAISIFWAVYAILLLAIGFAKRLRMIRIFGLIFFFITAGKVFLTIWQLGQLARIVSSLVFGVIALAASFMYAKYKDRLKEIVMSDN